MLWGLFAVPSLLHSQTDIFFNEVDYHGPQKGVGIYGPVGTNLDGYSIYVVNSDGTAAQAAVLDGDDVIAADVTSNLRGEIWIEVPILSIGGSGGGQNVGVILAAPDGLVKQFVSYGPVVNGTLSSTIDGVNSVVSEYIGDHVPGNSLQVTGQGCTYVDFAAQPGNTYANTQVPSHGALNENQVITCTADGGQNLLPIELRYFKGELQNNRILLAWGTATEQNNAAVEIQHSTDGRNFRTFYTETGGPDRDTPEDYSCVHRDFMSGDNYYRLVQTDLDGTQTIYETVLLIKGKGNLTFEVFPNPAVEYITLKTEQPTATDAEIVIFNSFGAPVLRLPTKSGVQTQFVDISVLPQGRYLLRYADGKEVHSVTLMKL